MKLLWIYPKWPFPADDGARQATVQLIRQLSILGADIHFCPIVPENENVDISHGKRHLGVGQITLIRREKPSRVRTLIHLLRNPSIPATFSAYATPQVSRAISDLIQSDPDRLVVYDVLHSASWMLRSQGRDLPPHHFVYRAHNIEKDLWIRGARDTRNPILKLFLLFQARQVDRFERAISEESDAVFPVSEVDAAHFSKITKSPVLSLPIGMEVPYTESDSPSEKKLLFVGRLDWPPNRDGLKWFLENVWPKAVEKSPDLQLTIVGSGDGSWLQPYLSLPGVVFKGRVESVSPYYSSHVASIVPIYFGSGTRVKAIESSLYGRVCISTALGVEGIPLESGRNLYHVERAEEWIDTLTKLDPAEAIRRGSAARELALKDFDPKGIAEKFLNTTKEISL